ncbi:MAG: hypothetical protein IPH41_11005 [Sulfuritalea sp.]|nr:hypothetical protein [Sulfuritalea sp.]
MDLAAAFGPMTPRQEGALRALGEYIHNVHAAGIPNIERWKPVVCLTPVDLQAVIEEFDAGLQSSTPPQLDGAKSRNPSPAWGAT